MLRTWQRLFLTYAPYSGLPSNIRTMASYLLHHRVIMHQYGNVIKCIEYKSILKAIYTTISAKGHIRPFLLHKTLFSSILSRQFWNTDFLSITIHVNIIVLKKSFFLDHRRRKAKNLIQLTFCSNFFMASYLYFFKRSDLDVDF